MVPLEAWPALEENEMRLHPLLTPSQRKFLLQKLLLEIGLNLLLLTFMVIALSAFHNLLAMASAILVVLYYSIFVRDYWLDLKTPPLQIQATFRKYKRQIRGPAQYFITEGQKQIRVPKQIWILIEPEFDYIVVYAPHTGWLLEYRKVV